MGSEQVVLTSIRLGFGVVGRIAPKVAAHRARRLFTEPRRHPRPEREKTLIARGTKLNLTGLSATSFGEGPITLLVHGWEGRGTQLGALVDPLVEQGRRVVALDGPAHGDSPGHRAEPKSFGEALVKVGAELGGVENVVAHSFGALCTTVAISRGLSVKRVAFLGGSSSPIHAMDRFIRFVNLPARAVPPFTEELSRIVGATQDELDGVKLARRFDVPALFIHDPNDAEVPIHEMESLHAAWRGSRLLRVDGPGHRRILWDPQVIRLLVPFLVGAERPSDSGAQA